MPIGFIGPWVSNWPYLPPLSAYRLSFPEIPSMLVAHDCQWLFPFAESARSKGRNRTSIAIPNRLRERQTSSLKLLGWCRSFWSLVKLRSGCVCVPSVGADPWYNDRRLCRRFSTAFKLVHALRSRAALKNKLRPARVNVRVRVATRRKVLVESMGYTLKFACHRFHWTVLSFSLVWAFEFRGCLRECVGDEVK